MPNLTTTSSPPVPRSLHDICTAVQRANCGQCWQVPDLPCTTSTITGRDGYHVARFGRAMRRGLISGDDLMIALRAAGVFTSATLIYDVLPGEPMQADTGASEGIAGHLAQLARSSPR